MRRNSEKLIKNFKKNYLGFTLVELIISVGIISTLSGLILPSFLNWIRTEKVNSYTRELREYFRVVRLDARRWGKTCNISTNSIPFDGVKNDKKYYGFLVSCDNKSNSINALAPAINNSIFQVISKDFLITPNGRISSEDSIIIVIGSKYHTKGSKVLNCLIIQSPTGHIIKGNFIEKEWVKKRMEVSQKDENNKLNIDRCKYS